MRPVENSYKWSGLSNENPKIIATDVKLIDHHGGKYLHSNTCGTTLQPKILMTSGTSLKDSDRLLDSYKNTIV